MPRRKTNEEQQVETPAVDLSASDGVVDAQEDGRVVLINGITDSKPLGFGIIVAGPNSSRAQMARDAMTRENIGRETPPSQDEMYAQGTRYLARISIGFEGRAIMDGKVLEGNETDFYKMYARYAYIRRQVDDFQGRRDNFLPE